MEKYIIIFLTAILLMGCNDSKCAIDENLRLDFKYNIETIKNFEKGKAIGVSNYLNSISYFTKLTGHESQVKLGGAIGYLDTTKLRQDLTKWDEWYNINKCTITKIKVDSILGDYKIKDIP